MIGIEYARRIALRCRDGAGVIEQLAQLVDRIAHVSAQHVFAEKLVKHLPHR